VRVSLPQRCVHFHQPGNANLTVPLAIKAPITPNRFHHVSRPPFRPRVHVVSSSPFHSRNAVSARKSSPPTVLFRLPGNANLPGLHAVTAPITLHRSSPASHPAIRPRLSLGGTIPAKLSGVFSSSRFQIQASHQLLQAPPDFVSNHVPA